MALNSIGNMTYINQASPATSSLQASHMHHQTPLNQAAFQEQMQRIEEVRPTEETHKVDDREGNGKREFNEQEAQDEEELDSNGKNFQENLQENLDENLENAMQKVKMQEAEKEITEDSMLMKPETHLLDIKG